LCGAAAKRLLSSLLMKGGPSVRGGLAVDPQQFPACQNKGHARTPP
jgi:hypothetical protein